MNSSQREVALRTLKRLATSDRQLDTRFVAGFEEFQRFNPKTFSGVLEPRYVVLLQKAEKAKLGLPSMEAKACIEELADFCADAIYEQTEAERDSWTKQLG